MKVLEIEGNQGLVEAYGVTRSADLAFVMPVEIGEYVLVHAGFAIQTIDEDEALYTQQLLQDMADSQEHSDAPPGSNPGAPGGSDINGGMRTQSGPGSVNEAIDK